MTEAVNRDGWRVVWTAFVVAVFGWGVGFYGPAVYLPALHRRAVGRSRQFRRQSRRIIWSVRLLITVLPDAYRRFGVGRVTIAGTLLAAAGAIAWANA